MNKQNILNKFKTKHRSIFCALFFIFIFTGSNFAQKVTKEERKLYKKAKKELINEDFKSAQTSYLKLVELNPNKEIYSFEGGLSYYFSDFERAKSIKLFETTLSNSKEDTIPEIYYYLARAYHLSGEYNKSVDAFNKFKTFIKTNTNDGKLLLRESDHYIKASNNGEKYLAEKDQNIKVINLSNKINSSFGEYAPVLKEDKILLFTSRRKGNSKKTDKDLLPFENVYVAKKIDNSWEILTDQNEIEKYIPSNLNTKKHDAGILYSSDGKTLYTYKNDAIWKSMLEKKQWSELVELDKNINSSKFNIPSISLSNDGNTMYFVAHRKDGIGGKDIYKSTKGTDENWSTATNLGDIINTVLDEDSPFLSKDGKTLYFSSKGHNGIGGYDIYKSNLINESWSTPKNLGIPINSSVDDIYFILDNKEKNGFLSSNRDGGIGGMDIYSICTECPTKTTNRINGLIVDINNSPINSGNVKLEKTNAKEIINTQQIQDGKFNISASTSGKHNLVVEAPNYEKQIINFSLPNKSTVTDLTLKLNQIENNGETYQIITATSNNLGLNISDTIKVEQLILSDSIKTTTEPITDQRTIASYHQKFNYNQKDLNINSNEYKDLIEKAVKKNSNIYVYIESSASSVPTKTFKNNIELASIRGNESKTIIINSLKAKGINRDRIIVKPINSIISGPNYSGDYKNVKKYQKFQYIKITIK
jgi:tetratricopeptide (TPR) repeat protein